MKHYLLKTLLFSMLFIFMTSHIVHASDEEADKPDEYRTEEAQEVFNPEDIVESQIDTLHLDELKGFWEDITNEYGGFLPESQKGSIYDFIKGEKEFSFDQWALGILKFVFHEFVVNGKLLGTLILLAVFSMFLQSLQNAFESGTVSKVAYAIVLMVLVILALNSFHIAMEYASDTVHKMTSFILALIPLLLALIASSGGLISAAFFHPVILFLMNTSGVLIQYVVFPLLFLSTLLHIVSTLSDQYKVTQLGNLLRNWSVGLLGIFLTVFLAVISIQGVSTAITDGVTLKTAKYVTSNFIPVIGRMFTDATDTVVTASVLLKNTVGIAGVAILMIIVAFPAIKILMIAFIYKFAAAVLQPLGGGPIIKCLDIISKSVMYVFAALAIVSLMFFLSITVVIVAGNLTMMVR
ncbi:stage III sporulation protein AE [Cytobacillus sp. FSL W7-1323]|uniref:Stage III sporulation protein AE n=1 Tax=Cytobacillus kochii TaxID=859143 RepID=A0A248TLL0_9BACI|nr:MULTISPECIES: stage III sporulation protein AE [Cytobacillus]ASV69042.1 stage III sporulation protein AE [Cytobacillus kochii]MDQ0183776.1 stage III sporulation protein AE [Cytobacillus kochii]MEA1853053.1 stage III sporulation protein AE [Cytobacillus sp. OWB-43]